MAYTPTAWADGDIITSDKLNKMEQGIQNEQVGADGADGYSPTVSITAITGGHRITITDKDGVKTFDVLDGVDGKSGDAGVSVTSVAQTTTSSADGGNNVITVTLSNGTSTTFNVKNGSKGSTGTAGATGEKGATGASVTAINLVTTEGAVTGGTCTLSDGSTVDITVTAT